MDFVVKVLKQMGMGLRLFLGFRFLRVLENVGSYCFRLGSGSLGFRDYGLGFRV